ncbi:hypothetical protein G5V58_13100 [Nocardioides anomalus]|uniref:Uncharacterized protein n=1 Tax=Nocardioides anomalus TaxID=2712223 RepID=A0A6G6WEV3_9ACTN|nr:hypothetical protein [Nocardioides anomalus]QIG43570.1 hypothetical protein G5V58_13100 [Nocardioides anomalus]
MTTFAMPRPHPVLRPLLAVAGAGGAGLDLTDDTLTVRLGPTWRATIPRGSITSAERDPRHTISVGAHGWRGEWLVNTSPRGLVVLHLDPPAAARCLGVPLRVHTLRVSLDDPEAFLGALGRG